MPPDGRSRKAGGRCFFKLDVCRPPVSTPGLRPSAPEKDRLTTFSIDMTEKAIEPAYQVPKGWFSTSMHEGTEDAGDLKVRDFHLRHEA